jgi:hypothetical protein
MIFSNQNAATLDRAILVLQKHGLYDHSGTILLFSRGTHLMDRSLAGFGCGILVALLAGLAGLILVLWKAFLFVQT